MRNKKTPQTKRETYCYIVKDENGKEQELIVRSGENGVTEKHIAELHALDDKEMRNNSKNETRPYSKSEKEAIREWQDKHPGDTLSGRKNISLDYCMENPNSEESKRVLNETSEQNDELSPDIMRLRELVEDLSEFDKKIYHTVMLGGVTQVEAGKLFGLSNTTIEYHVNKIRKYILENF